MRLDQWLWGVRLYKSRTLATEGIRGGHVKVNGETAKPARELRLGDWVDVQMGPLARKLQVVAEPPGRVGAKLVPLYATDHTPPAAYAAARTAVQPGPGFRQRGTGRPTKRDRRRLDKLAL